MTGTEILDLICADLPEIPCVSGCVDCCTVSLWSKSEWQRLPVELRGDRLGLAKVPMRVSGGRTVTAYLPLHAGKMMALAAKSKMAVTMPVETGILIASFGLDGITCIFRDPEIGCKVYDYRPFTCRIMGASAVPGPLRCPRGIECAAPMPETVIMQRFLMWTNLFEDDPRYRSKP